MNRRQRRVIHEPDGSLTLKTSIDVTQPLKNAERLRNTGAAPMSDSVCVGSIDMELLFTLAKQAGVRIDDGEALGEFAFTLLQGGKIGGVDGADFSKFRVYGGKV